MPGSVATEFSGAVTSEHEDWKLSPDDVAEVVGSDLLLPLADGEKVQRDRRDNGRTRKQASDDVDPMLSQEAGKEPAADEYNQPCDLEPVGKSQIGEGGR